MVVPSKRLWLFFAFGIVIALGGAVVPGLEMAAIPYNLALLVLWYVSGKMALKHVPVEVSRQTDTVLAARQKNNVTVRVENVTNRNVKVTIRDEPPVNCDSEFEEMSFTVKPFRQVSWTYTVVPKSRGAWEFQGTYVRYPAPLGLAICQVKLPTDGPVRVYPNIHAVKEFDLLKQKGHLSLMGMRRSRVRGLGQEFESLRDYNDDDFRLIDWKASARRGKLVVKNFEQETNQGVVVCVDLGRHMLGEVAGVRKLEYCLDAALLLMHAASQAGDQVGLLLFNDVVQRYVRPNKGRAHIATLLDAMYDAQAEPVQPHYSSAFSYLAAHWKRRSLIVVFTDAENEDQAVDMSAALRQLRRRHLVYVVRVSDPRLRKLVESPVVDDQSLFDRAAALWYAGDRRRAETVLKNAGLHSLESEPETLAADLVSAYLRVKELAQL